MIMWRLKSNSGEFSAYETLEDLSKLWKHDKTAQQSKTAKKQLSQQEHYKSTNTCSNNNNNNKSKYKSSKNKVNMDNQNNNSNSRLDKDKCEKLKRFILIGVLAVVGIVGWHIYEYFFAEKPSADHETPVEHEIIDLTQRLFNDELQLNTYPVSANFQGRTKSFARDDRAAQPLLHVANELWSNDPTSTVNLLRRLFDNYELDVHTVEKTTPEQEQEELDFLHAVLKTPIMKHTMKFLQQKPLWPVFSISIYPSYKFKRIRIRQPTDLVTADYNAQLQLLKDIWFTQYSRSQGRMGSSGFEHVFLAELKDDNIIGLHNWVYFQEQEAKGNLDYKGYIEQMHLDKEKYVLATRFSFHNHVKPYNTLFIGTSPEFELSVYTVCFLLHVDEPCPVQLGHTKFSINTNVWNWRGRKTLAAAYPSIEK